MTGPPRSQEGSSDHHPTQQKRTTGTGGRNSSGWQNKPQGVYGGTELEMRTQRLLETYSFRDWALNPEGTKWRQRQGQGTGFF